MFKFILTTEYIPTNHLFLKNLQQPAPINHQLIKLRAGYKLLRKKLGFRYLMDGSYIGKRITRGAVNAGKDFHPVFISDVPFSEEEL